MSVQQQNYWKYSRHFCWPWKTFLHKLWWFLPRFWNNPYPFVLCPLRMFINHVSSSSIPSFTSSTSIFSWYIGCPIQGDYILWRLTQVDWILFVFYYLERCFLFDLFRFILPHPFHEGYPFITLWAVRCSVIVPTWFLILYSSWYDPSQQIFLSWIEGYHSNVLFVFFWSSSISSTFGTSSVTFGWIHG